MHNLSGSGGTGLNLSSDVNYYFTKFTRSGLPAYVLRCLLCLLAFILQWDPRFDSVKFGLKILGSTHALSRTSHKAVIPTALIVTVPHVTAPLRGSASEGYKDSNWGLLSAPLGESMTIIINSWIPSVLIEKSSYQKLSFWDQTAIKSPLIIFWWVEHMPFENICNLLLCGKTQDIANLIIKQSNNLINLEITFLTITSPKKRHPAQRH